jgi:hypothetical protein
LSRDAPRLQKNVRIVFWSQARAATPQLRSGSHRVHFTQDVKQRVYSHSLLGKRAASVHLTLVRRAILAKPLGHRINRPDFRRTPMKKLIIAVALVVASASPVLAEGFPNVYLTR